MLQILHNPRCSKSRQTLALLQEHNHQPQIIDYMKNPLSAEQMHTIVNELGFDSARQWLRTKEADYKALNLQNPDLSDAQLIEAMLAHPKLIERPVVRYQGKAAIGRPPESVLALFA